MAVERQIHFDELGPQVTRKLDGDVAGLGPPGKDRDDGLDEHLKEGTAQALRGVAQIDPHGPRHDSRVGGLVYFAGAVKEQRAPAFRTPRSPKGTPSQSVADGRS